MLNESHSEHLKRFFADRLKNSAYWLSDAQLMYRSSRILFETQLIALSKFIKAEDSMPHDWTLVDIELFRPALMQTGFAIELLLKATAIKIGHKPEKVIGKSHRMNDLTNMAMFTPTPKESELLELLERSILWSGRYPIPKKVEKFDFGRVDDFGGTHIIPKQMKETEDLYEKIKSSYYRMAKADV